jgi:hypothetical protein
LRFLFAIVHGRRQTFIGLGTYSTWLDIRVQIMIAILTGAKVATLRVGTNGVLVTVIGEAIRTLILTDAMAFPITLVKALLAGTSPSNAQRVLKFRTAVGIRLAPLWWNSPWGRGATGDAVADEVVVASANWQIVRGHLAACIFMAKEINTHVAWNASDRTPFHWHVVLDVASTGKNGIVARKTTTFESLWRVVVDTE